MVNNKRHMSKGTTRKQVANIVKSITMDQLDSRVHDKSSGASPLEPFIGTPILTQLNEVAKGTTKNDRTGFDCFLTRETLRLIVAQVAQTIVRVMIVTPKRGKASLVISDLPALWYTEADLIEGQYNVIADTTYLCDDSADMKKIEWSRSFKKGTRSYFHTSGSPLNKRPLYLYLLSDVLTGSKPSIHCNYRLWFKDNAAE